MPDSLAVSLRRLQFHALVGILPHEREFAQPLEVDVTAFVADARRGAPVVDYRGLLAAVTARVERGEIRYLEDFAHDICDAALALGGVSRVRIVVRKPHVPLGVPLDCSEIVLERDA